MLKWQGKYKKKYVIRSLIKYTVQKSVSITILKQNEQ